MPYDYSRNSLNNFVQKQGGTLANLGASPTYTGAPTKAGTPPGGQPGFGGATTSPARPYQMNPGIRQPQFQGGVQSMGQQTDPRMAAMNRRQQMMRQQQGSPMISPQAMQDPRRRQQVMEMIRRRQANQPMRGNLSRLGMRR